MKKLKISLILIVALGVLMSCQANRDQAHAFSADTLHTELRSVSEGGEGVFRETVPSMQEPEPYQNANAELTKQIEVLGVQYDLTYQESVLFGDTAIPTDIYALQNLEEPSRVFFDASTGEILKYHYLPYTQSLVSEQDYISFIQSVLGGAISDDYDYICTTHYYEQNEDGVRSRVEDGFIVCGENQRLGDYSFYYTKSLNGLELPDYISANFLDGYFLIEKMETEENKAAYADIASNLDTINAHIEQVISQAMNEDILCKNVEVSSQRVIHQEEQVKILSNLVVTFSRNSDQDAVEFQMVVQTVTGWGDSD